MVEWTPVCRPQGYHTTLMDFDLVAIDQHWENKPMWRELTFVERT